MDHSTKDTLDEERITKALDKALLPGRLHSTNALIQHKDGKLWLVCGINPDRRWLNFTPCCARRPTPIIQRKRRSKEYPKCNVCNKHADILKYLKPTVMSAFETETIEPPETPIGEWVLLGLIKYDNHPVWK